jgi:L-2-hydroxycarboxylate dehydrogenase (NAD+)
MKLTIQEAKELAARFISSLGFNPEETELIVENTMEAELSGHLSHGLGNLLWFKTTVGTGGVNKTPINRSGAEIKTIKETPVSQMLDGRNRTGFVVMRTALERALVKVKDTLLVASALTNTAPTTGFLGHYARLAAEKDLIFMCWNTSPGRVAPYGSTSRLWGTNPITIAVPTERLPAILDMATAKITVGQLLKYQREHQDLPPESAIDKQGNLTIDPVLAWDEGSLIPIGGHKGSGLSFMNEMLAGALTASKVGFAVAGGWGTFFILIDPSMFRDIKDFKRDVQAGINELKASQKRVGVTEIYYPGEQSQKKRLENLKNGFIIVEDTVYEQLHI